MFTDDFHAWLVEAKLKYSEAKKLFDSTSDPPSEPYKSKYASKELIIELLSEINNKWKDIDNVRVKTVTGFLKYFLGKICMETEECSQGKEFLSSALQETQEIDSSPQCVTLTLCILNQLGILWSGLGELPQALEFLLKAEKLHNNFKENPDASPFSVEGIFTPGNEDKGGLEEFEKNFTQTLYYLAQVYGHMKEGAKSAFYCRETLKRQKESGEYETHDWAINCATLSLYYLGEKKFQEVRHLLSCAAFVLLRYKIKIENDLIDDPESWFQIHRTKASISCSWLKYAINVLKSSSEIESDKLTSWLIEDEEVQAMEKRIPCQVLNYEDARTLFIFAQDHVSVATSYYTLNEHANNHALVVQDHSALYKALTLHDRDLSRQCKLHKRRIDMLEGLLEKLNPQFYLSVCRQLQFELGETYYEMLTLKTAIAEETGKRVAGKIATKINQLSLKGLSHFKDFINSLKDRNGDLPSEFSDDLVRPALIAHFYLGRYYTRVVEVEKEKAVNKMKLAEECYKFIVKYTERNPEHAKHVEEELRVIKEMLELMPEKFTQSDEEE